jgi:SAM-dependent methyltransferase
MGEYVYRPGAAFTDFDAAAEALARRVRQPVARAWVDHTNPANVEAVVERLRMLGVPCEDLTIDVVEWRAYVNEAGYRSWYPGYYPDYLIEKSLEHHLSLKMLDLRQGQVFIDVASEGSPLPEIMTRLLGCRSFAQDIMYEPGMQGTRIGGDAVAMPVPDGFAQGVCLTCSLEHFEGNADSRLFQELGRVLSPGGRVVIIPLYIMPKAAVQTDPVVSATLDVSFDEDATIFCAQGWGNRHSRFYSPDTLVSRIVEPCRDVFRFAVYRLRNPTHVDVSVYARFLLVATKV